jgi:DNA (cytosine-5)-methyltransferase 1
MSFKFIDLFAGIGGMRLPFEEMGGKCVFTSDWDKDAQNIYEANFGEKPHGDITKINENDIPDHDILLAGFPCQPFSIIGSRKGFEDTRGTLFFDIEGILKAKRPKAFLLENVKQLRGHDQGRTLNIILNHLAALGYHVHWKVLNALDFGLPHKRERIFIVGFKTNYEFKFPLGTITRPPLSTILEKKVDRSYFASKEIQKRMDTEHKSQHNPGIWHINKGGNISSHPYSCALRAGASYNYLLVNGKRRLTPRECLRLLGFPDSYKIVLNYMQMRKVTGNGVCVPVVRALAKEMIPCLKGEKPIKATSDPLLSEQLSIFLSKIDRKDHELALSGR